MIRETTKALFALFGIEVRRNKFLQVNGLNAFLIPPEEWEKRPDGYYLKLLDITIADRSSPLLEGYKYARRIALTGEGKFFYDDEKLLQLKIHGLFFYIEFPDELFVINEVFISGDYNFVSAEKIIVVDIGFNIGVTSLFFAQQNNVHKVFAYEIFPQTYESALRNMKLNDAAKVEPFNFGLGKANREMDVEYAPVNKARMGIHGLPKNERYDQVETVRVVMKDVAEEFARISSLTNGFRKICKMDCEGSEFEILDHLFQEKAISLMDVYLIEWHDFDPVRIIDNFLVNGFEVVKTISSNPATGLIYAFKR